MLGCASFCVIDYIYRCDIIVYVKKFFVRLMYFLQMMVSGVGLAVALVSILMAGKYLISCEILAGTVEISETAKNEAGEEIETGDVVVEGAEDGEGGGVEGEENQESGANGENSGKENAEDVKWEALPILAAAPTLIEPVTLQEAVDKWLETYAHGEVGIEVYDVNNATVVASYRSTAQMRPRSIYKLFYYYDAYAQVEA